MQPLHRGAQALLAPMLSLQRGTQALSTPMLPLQRGAQGLCASMLSQQRGQQGLCGPMFSLQRGVYSDETDPLGRRNALRWRERWVGLSLVRPRIRSPRIRRPAADSRRYFTITT